MDFSRYKACLFDVDKTLTNTKKELTSRTREALSRLSRNGIQIGVCTGRHYATVRSLLAQNFLPSDIHVVCGGGEVISSNGEILSAHYIDSQHVRSIVELASKTGSRVLLQCGNELYGNAEAISHAQSYFLSDASFTVPQDVVDLSNWEMCAILTVGNLTDEFISNVHTLPLQVKIMKNYSGIPYIDVTAPGVTKATGVAEWCRISGIKPEEIVGFGDSENDLEFLQTVGHAVAMGNASEAVKQIADEVTTDCDHDGVAEWIERQLQAKS